MKQNTYPLFQSSSFVKIIEEKWVTNQHQGKNLPDIITTRVTNKTTLWKFINGLRIYESRSWFWNENLISLYLVTSFKFIFSLFSDKNINLIKILSRDY